MKNLILLLAIAIVAGAHAAKKTTVAQQPPATLPPVLVTGRVIDYEGLGIQQAEVRVRKGATLLARASVGSFDADTSANYALSVPMSNSNIPTTACAGDSLIVEVDDGDATYTNENSTISVGAPGQIVRLDIRAASCTNPYGVSDLYLEEITDWAYDYGYDDFFDANGNYQPNADYDGDGVSNYNEYLTGSDPFDPDDAGLKILSWSEVEGDPSLMVATFLAGVNRSYFAERAGKRDNGGIGEFSITSHLEAQDSSDPRNYFTPDRTEVHAIYLYKNGNTGLFRLRQD